MHVQHRVGSSGTRAHRTSRLPANGPTTGPRGRNPPETARRVGSRPSRRGLPAVRERAPWVHSGTRRARRRAARSPVEPHIPRSDGDFRSRGSRAGTTSFHGSVSTPSKTARTGRRERSTPVTAAPMTLPRARRAASTAADGPVWVAEAGRGPLLDSVGTDRAAWPSPCSRARPRIDENSASSAHGKQ